MLKKTMNCSFLDRNGFSIGKQKFLFLEKISYLFMDSGIRLC